MNCNRRKTNKKQREKQIKVTNKTIARTNARYTILPFKWYMANRCITLFSLGIFRQSKNIVIWLKLKYRILRANLKASPLIVKAKCKYNVNRSSQIRSKQGEKTMWMAINWKRTKPVLLQDEHLLLCIHHVSNQHVFKMSQTAINTTGKYTSGELVVLHIAFTAIIWRIWVEQNNTFYRSNNTWCWL